MKISKRQLKRIIREEYSRLTRRGLIKENVTNMVVRDLCALVRSHENPNDPNAWQGYCRYYDDLMMDFRVEMDEEADAFLMQFDLEFCPSSAEALCAKLEDPRVQNHPMFKSYTDMLYGGFELESYR